MFLIDLLHKLGIIICVAFLSLVKSILNLIFDIANIEFFKEDVIGSILTRVYIIMGVLMLFKITISCVQYLINPDKAEDKENGFGGIIKRSLISISLLAIVPAIFNFAKTAQNAILEALPKVILGQETTTNIEEIGESISYTTALSFFGYKTDNCNDGSIGGLAGEKTNPTFSSIGDILKNTNTIVDSKCGDAKRYRFNLLIGIPTSAFLVIILASMVIDVGIRVVKFGFLEMVAPIPIVSYIDPKTSKKSFDSWVHNTLSVYADLFIRLGVIYLILHLFMILLPSFSLSFKLNDGTTLPTGRSLLVNVAIIISLFFFAKNAPKFICEVFGIKGDGSIGDMFKRAGGLGALGLGAARDTKAAYTNKLNKLKKANGGTLKSGDRAEALRTAFKTTGSSLKGGTRAVLSGKGFKDTMSASMSSAARGYGLREMLKDKGVSAREYRREVWNRRMGIQSDFDETNREIEAAKSASDKSKAGLDYVHNNMSEKFSNVVFRNMADVNHVTEGKGINVTLYDSTGSAINLTGADLVAGNSRGLTIAGVMESLKQIVANPNGTYTGQQIANAKGQLDKLQGYADKFIVNNANDASVVPENVAFLNILQDAMDAISEHSSDTEFGRRLIREGKSQGILDSNGNVISGREGDWLALNKKEGQSEQTSAKQSMGNKMAGMIAKEIADKYDKKGS